MSDWAKDNIAHGTGDANQGRRKPPPFALAAPALCRGGQFVDGAAQIGSVADIRHNSAEARKNSVTEIFVDAAATPLDHRHEPRLVLAEKANQFLRRTAMRQRGEATQIGDQDGRVAALATHARGISVASPDLLGALGREETRQVARRAFPGARSGEPLAA